MLRTRATDGVCEQDQLAETDAENTDGSTKWNFQLHADHLDAADLDRWMGPRARPGWLQRLLPSLLGASAVNSTATELLHRIDAEVLHDWQQDRRWDLTFGLHHH